MTPARRAALESIRHQLTVTQATIDAFARSEDDYATQCFLDNAASYVGNAVDEIANAEAAQ